ncbi:MAG: biopolymer transporter ExbD [Candidatus Eisenbacteria bacterium]|jgi:biopolymer transport protein TolR|uniref:Biopolymer transporter ExbD n=1 Tax=Eiseniibacteriota bacterium TaxID=2212470 RepID=A0A538TI49_UNCEI|nr:MAG: biopolymer transporter ExbD [Candidatus Eisenbacteria bacterium]
MRRTRVRHEEGIFEPNMTPLIDVSLVLVVILMVATPLAFQSSIAVQRAAQAARKAAIVADTERIEITIVSQETVLVNKNQIPRSSLAALLKPLLDASPSKVVVVRCADGVTHGSFVSVLDDAKACGASQIAVVGG